VVGVGYLGSWVKTEHCQPDNPEGGPGTGQLLCWDLGAAAGAAGVGLGYAALAPAACVVVCV
jgi:hypothetical protein